MEVLFENEQFILKSTGRDYDFVGIIETKTDEPLTFFFSEELCADDEDDGEEDYDRDSYIDENKTELLGVYEGLKSREDNCDADDDDEEETAYDLQADDWFRTRDDKSTGFLSDCRERGQFLAIIKYYCPEKLERIPWL